MPKGIYQHKKQSRETIEKRRKTLTGKKRSEAFCINNGIVRKGKPRLDERGDKHHNWKGGITPQNHTVRDSLEYKLWREAVYIRDNWICQKCKDATGGNLVAHHILNFSEWVELRFAIDNGITFCRTCHEEFHSIYAVKNNTREQLLEFLNK